jgi:hypothetical protein
LANTYPAAQAKAVQAGRDNDCGKYRGAHERAPFVVFLESMVLKCGIRFSGSDHAQRTNGRGPGGASFCGPA